MIFRSRISLVKVLTVCKCNTIGLKKLDYTKKIPFQYSPKKIVHYAQNYKKFGPKNLMTKKRQKKFKTFSKKLHPKKNHCYKISQKSMQITKIATNRRKKIISQKKNSKKKIPKIPKKPKNIQKRPKTPQKDTNTHFERISSKQKHLKKIWQKFLAPNWNTKCKKIFIYFI